MKIKPSWLSWVLITVVVIYLSWEVIRPFLSPILFAIVASYLVFPVYRKIINMGFTKRQSSGILTAFFGLVIVLLIYGVFNWYNSVIATLRDLIDRIPDLTQQLEIVPVSWEFIFSDLSRGVTSRLASITLSLPRLVLQSIVFIILFWYFMNHSDRLVNKIMSLLPKDREELANRLLNKANLTLKSVIRVWLLLGVVKSILVGIGFYLFVTGPVLSILIGSLAIFLEILPMVGGWVLWSAGALYLLTEGNIISAVLLSIYGIILIAPVPDIFVRPKLAAEGAHVNYIIMLIGMLGGVLAFGFKGLVLGPISLSLLTVLVKEWEKEI